MTSITWCWTHQAHLIHSEAYKKCFHQEAWWIYDMTMPAPTASPTTFLISTRPITCSRAKKITRYFMSFNSIPMIILCYLSLVCWYYLGTLKTIIKTKVTKLESVKFSSFGNLQQSASHSASHSAKSWVWSSGIKLYQSTKFHIACYTPLER
jgi:hypothetical protein